MATVIHEHGDERPQVVREYHHDTDDAGGIGAIIATILILFLLAILLFYGIPLLRSAANRSSSPPSINVNLNTPQNSGTNTGATTPTTPTPATP